MKKGENSANLKENSGLNSKNSSLNSADTALAKNDKIKIDDFKKIIIQIATVKHCERVEGSEKLLKFILELENGEQRQVLSGIAKFYEPQSLINKQVCVLTNLKKAKIFGLESDGMILSAKSGDKLVLIAPEVLVESGSFVG